MPKLAELRQTRATKVDEFTALANKASLDEAEQRSYVALKTEIINLNGQIERTTEALDFAARSAQPVAGQDQHWRVPARPEDDPYANDNAARSLAGSRGTLEGSAKSLVVGGMLKMCGLANGDLRRAREIAGEIYGESHPVTRALITSAGAAGGFIVPPDYMNEIIELLRPMAVVRSAGPRMIPMPRGTMRLPGQASPASATYGAEDTQITQSQQSLASILATYKKMTALVPISNDMMRYADPAVDAFVRDDLVKVMALREDLAFLTGDGTQDTPLGYLAFAQRWVQNQGGTAGFFSSTADSVFAVNGAAGSALIGANGGNFITANQTVTLATAAAEFGGAINKLDTANVPAMKRAWFWNPRTKNYLYNVQNSLGVYVYRDEMNGGKFLGCPFYTSTQVPIGLWNADGTNKDLSLVFLVEMTEDMILDSMTLELAVSREGTYVNSSGSTVSAFQNDETLIRAIAEHDHQIRHDSAVAVIQAARYAPAIS